MADKTPKCSIKVVNTTQHFYYDVKIGRETFRLGYHGDIIETKYNGLYFLATPYHGITQTQRLFKLQEISNLTVKE